MKYDPIIAYLAGTYSLLNTSNTENGVSVPDRAYGHAPVGILTYSKSGYMSATIASTDPADRPSNLTFPYQPTQSDADWALVGKHTNGYAGHFSVSDAIPASKESGQLFHGPLIAASTPSWVGTRQIRNYTTYEGGKYLKIVSQRDLGNVGILWWKRLD